MSTLAVRKGRGILSRTMWSFALRDSSSSFNSSCSRRSGINRMWMYSETRGNMSAHFAISRTAASSVHPTGSVVWWGKATRHNSRVHSSAGKLAVAGNGRGVIVGCLQQYRKRWGFVRMATSRAGRPHAFHEKQQQQQQREKSREKHTWVFRLPVLFWSGNISRGRGTGLVVIGGVFVGMDD